MLSIKLQDITPKTKKTQVLCAFVTQNTAAGLDGLDPQIMQEIKQSIKEMGDTLGKTSVITTLNKLGAKKILLVGLGKKITNDSFRFAAGKIALYAKNVGVTEISIIIPKGSSAKQLLHTSQIIEGLKMSLFSFDVYKEPKKDARKLSDVTLLGPNTPQINKIITHSSKVSDAVTFTKEIANLPPNDCPPAKLADIAKSIITAKTKNSIKCTIISKNELKTKGFGGITAVGQGSKNEPKLIILEYNGGKLQEKPVVIVGKAVTFDTGGISIKPGAKMDEMKFDKCGGCTVLGIMKAVSELKIPQNIVGVIPSVENMPSSSSYRPGDIIKLYSKKTAEILNTDAEGRLILADAISYAEQKYTPKAIIDFATLTGACIIALGNNVAGMVTNNAQLAYKFKESSRNTSEEIWQLPLNDDYIDMIKSNIADIKNMGIDKAAGTIAAAAFLHQAIKNQTPWIHFDIAGVAWTQSATKYKPYNPKGATGFGVRLVLDYISKIK